MCSESLPKEFEKSTEVLPFTKYGISTFDEFKRLEEDIQKTEWLKKVGLSNEEIKLYQQNEANLLDQRKKIESNILGDKLAIIYSKIKAFHNEPSSSKDEDHTTDSNPTNIFEKLQQKPNTFYPEGHPMNNIKEIEKNLFEHLQDDDRLPLTKRRKILRRLERKKERIKSQENELIFTVQNTSTGLRPGSLWDVKEKPARVKRDTEEVIGPKKRTMYTIKDSKIVRLQPVAQQVQDEYNAVDIVVPINATEGQLLEGTKMSLDNIRSIERFKDYVPGEPSKVLYLKNIALAVSHEQLSLLFNQFVLDNGGPVDVRLMSGRMRGQAFVSFQNEDIALRALEEVNGTILSGRPIIVQFSRHSNHDRQQIGVEKC